MRARSDAELLNGLEAAVRAGHCHGLFMSDDGLGLTAGRSEVCPFVLDELGVEVVAVRKRTIRSLLNAVLDDFVSYRAGRA